MSTPTAPPQAKPGAQAPALARFRSGTQRTLSSDGYFNSTTPGASAVDLPVYNPSSNNYLRGLWIQTKCTTSANAATVVFAGDMRSEEHTSELQSHVNLVCRLLLEKKKNKK